LDAREADRRRILWIWIAPGVLFFTFVFLNYVNSGYLLVLAPPVFAVLAKRLHAFLTSSRSPQWRRIAVAAGVIVNCAFFAFAPVYCSYASIRDFERELTAITRDFQSALNPEDTLIVGFDSHFLGYRHAGYYLPEFMVAQYPEVSYADGKRVFVMQGRDTRVTPHLPAGQYRQVIFFPLPQGAEYTVYLERFRTKLPPGTLEEKMVGTRKVLSGPASAIPVLFPSTAK
jgi:hypothetical protein